MRSLLAVVIASTLASSPLAAPALRSPPRMAELTFDRAGYVDLLRKLIGENRCAVRMPAHAFLCAHGVFCRLLACGDHARRSRVSE